jgi:hypothetical protein
MRIRVESMPSVVQLDIGGGQVVPARLWEGVTESGTPVAAFITRISPQTRDPAAVAQFEAELVAVAAPALAAPDPPDALDRRRAEALTARILAAIHPELAASPHADNVYVALNALAGAAAVILAGTGKDARALAFFDCALVRNLGRDDTMTTREQHIAWAKERALEHVDRGDLADAVAALIIDLGKHEETRDIEIGVLRDALTVGQSSDAARVRRWIEEFR